MLKVAPIELLANGQSHRGWHAVRLFESVSRPGLEATLSFFHKPDALPIKADDSFELWHNNVQLAAGEIRLRRTVCTHAEGRAISVSGWDSIGRLTKFHSARDHHWQNVRLDAIATDILREAGLGTPIFSAPFSITFPEFRLQLGDNLLDTLARALQFESQAMRWLPDRQKVLFYGIGDDGGPSAKFPAEGVLQSELNEDNSSRYSLYKVIAETPAIQWQQADDAIQEPAQVKDSGIQDGSVLVTVANNPSEAGGLKKLAQYQRAIHLGRARSYSQLLDSWSLAAKYPLGSSVHVEDSIQGLDHDMILAEREYSFDQKKGQQAQLKFVPAEAFAAQPDALFSRGKGVTKQWGENQ